MPATANAHPPARHSERIGVPVVIGRNERLEHHHTAAYLQNHAGMGLPWNPLIRFDPRRAYRDSTSGSTSSSVFQGKQLKGHRHDQGRRQET